MTSPYDIELLRFDTPMGYSKAYELQVERRKAVERGEAGSALFLLEHSPVITMGRNAHETNLLKSPEEYAALGIEVCEVSRGGDVTYHGPGQLVAYPVINLALWQKSIRWYLRALEDVIIAVLYSYGLQGERSEGQTGVWVSNAKVAAIGIGLHGWVTYHGISLNVKPDMTHFQTIIPCGIQDKPVTSLAMLLESCPTMAEVTERFSTAFLDYFATAPKAES